MTYKKLETSLRQYVPWKWMAPEFINTRCFTLASDVWSFGVVLWEMFSFGQEPYPGDTVEELITKLKNGYSLPCPEEMDKVGLLSNLYAIIFIHIDYLAMLITMKIFQLTFRLLHGPQKKFITNLLQTVSKKTH